MLEENKMKLEITDSETFSDNYSEYKLALPDWMKTFFGYSRLFDFIYS